MTPGSWVAEDPGRLTRRLDVEVGQERVGEGAVSGVGVAARDVDVASAGAVISNARRLASLTPRAGRSREGGFRQGGFPPAVEDREQPFERARVGHVHALGGGRLGRQDQQQASLARGVRSARPDLHAHPLARRAAVVVDDAVDRPSGDVAAELGREQSLRPVGILVPCRAQRGKTRRA